MHLFYMVYGLQDCTSDRQFWYLWIMCNEAHMQVMLTWGWDTFLIT